MVFCFSSRYVNESSRGILLVFLLAEILSCRCSTSEVDDWSKCEVARDNDITTKTRPSINDIFCQRLNLFIQFSYTNIWFVNNSTGDVAVRVAVPADVLP